MDYVYEYEMKARDYECDAQGVVNNANYLHYCEVARHEFLEARGARFSRLHERGIDVMVARLEARYKYPLRGGDRFVVRLALWREGARLVVLHDLVGLTDGRHHARCTAGLVATRDGRLLDGSLFDALLGDNAGGFCP
jgi:acyl-CoA thioester hydrolase